MGFESQNIGNTPSKTKTESKSKNQKDESGDDSQNGDVKRRSTDGKVDRFDENRKGLKKTAIEKRPTRCRGRSSRNPFLNFLRHYRQQAGNGKVVQMSVEAAKVWNRMSLKARQPFVEQARGARRLTGGVHRKIRSSRCGRRRRKRSRCGRRRKRSRCGRRRKRSRCGRRRRSRRRRSRCGRRRRSRRSRCRSRRRSRRSCSRRRRRRSCRRRRCSSSPGDSIYSYTKLVKCEDRNPDINSKIFDFYL